MRRAEGWDRRLIEMIEAHRHEPFAWGTHDCMTFAIADYEAMMGEPPDGAPSWSSHEEAEALLVDRDLAGWLDLILGPHADGWMTGRRGDLAIVDLPKVGSTPAMEICGVITGPSIACLGLAGMVFAPLNRARMVWKVGE